MVIMPRKGISMKINKNQIGLVAALVTALVISPLTIARAADTPTLGRACSAEGANTGTSTDSLVCKSVGGKLIWQKVRLGANYGTPVSAPSNFTTGAQKIRLFSRPLSISFKMQTQEQPLTK
jgi:raffinose/stachyose/melibiose transport system substrate-binding protein